MSTHVVNKGETLVLKKVGGDLFSASSLESGSEMLLLIALLRLCSSAFLVCSRLLDCLLSFVVGVLGALAICCVGLLLRTDVVIWVRWLVEFGDGGELAVFCPSCFAAPWCSAIAPHSRTIH